MRASTRALLAALLLAAGPGLGPAAGAPLASPLRVEVAGDGPVAVTGRALAAAGWIGPIDVRRLRLTRAGQPVALHVLRADPATSAMAPLAPTDAVRFVGRAADSPFAAVRSYQMAYGGPDGPGPGWTARPAAPDAGAPEVREVPAEAVIEEDTVYLADFRPGGGDRWAWDRALGPGEARQVALDVGPATSAPARVTVALQGATDDPAHAPDHRARLRLGGAVLAEAAFDGFDGAALSAWLPEGALAGPPPALRLESVPGGALVDGWHLDRVHVAFQARLDAPLGRVSFLRPAAQDDRPITYRLGGFPGAAPPRITVLDATDPDRPVRLEGVVVAPEAAAGPGGGPGSGEGSGQGPPTWSARFTDRAPAGTRYLAWAEVPALEPAGPGAPAPEPSIPDAPGSRWPAAPTAVLPADDAVLPTAGGWLIIAGDGLAPALAPLVAARARQGLRPAVADVRAVYQAFGDGTPDPAAIQRFIRHAVTTWRPAPRAVVLVGEANLDHRGGYARARGSAGPPNRLPALQVELADGTAATSDWPLADVDGDGAPDVAIGRLPGATLDEVARVAGKLARRAMARIDEPEPRIVLVTDGARPDAFPAAAEGWARAAAGAAPTALRLYATSPSTPPDLPAAIRGALRDGARVVGYIGHGNVDTWAPWPGAGGRLLGTADLLALPTGDRLGLLVSATCLNAWFDHPVKATSLAEAWLLAPGGGTAAFAPTGYARLEGQAALVEHLLARLSQDPTAPLGDAVLHVLRAADAGAYGPEVAEAARAFAFLGDPAAPLVAAAERGGETTLWLPFGWR